MRGTVRWQGVAEGLKHAASLWVDLWPCSFPCFHRFPGSAHSSCSFQQEPSLFPALTVERVLILTTPWNATCREKANEWQMMKTPCPGCYQECWPIPCAQTQLRTLHSPSALLGIWDCFILVLREPAVWSWEVPSPPPTLPPAWAAGKWLCPLLGKSRHAETFLFVDIPEPADNFAQRNIAFRNQFQPHRHFQPKFAFKIWIRWEGTGLVALIEAKGLGDVDSALHKEKKGRGKWQVVSGAFYCDRPCFFAT